MEDARHLGDVKICMIGGSGGGVSFPITTDKGGTGNTAGYIRTGQKANTEMGENATAEGSDTESSGDHSHAEGDRTVASGYAAHAEGSQATASGDYSHAEGNSEASGEYSHSEGDSCVASGKYSHAGGNTATASGWGAFAHGEAVTAGYSHQTVVGHGNDNKSGTLFEVGNGTGLTLSDVSNAFEVYSDGKISCDNGSSKFQFTQNSGVDGYYDASGTWHAFGSGGKQTTIIDLSESNVVLDESLTDTVTVTTNADGALSVTSSDTSIATASISNGVVTINAVKEGACSIEVTAAETSSYYGAKAYINVTVAISIYGAEWDGSSSPAWTRTDMATNFVDPVPYYSGMSGTPSSPFDDILPFKGLRIVEDAEAGTLVELPKFYYSEAKSGDKFGTRLSMKPFTGCHVSPAHADRGDGVGERDYVYVGRYHCASDYKSKTGVTPLTNKTRAEFRAGIAALGNDVWQWDYAMLRTIQILYEAEFANWNSQAKIGYGCGNNLSVQNMGASDAMPYHTGTVQTGRDVYGVGVQYRYIEDLWGNAATWVDGIRFSGANVYCIKNPADFSDTSNGVLTNTRTTSTGDNYIKSYNISSESGYEYAVYPNATISSVEYVCDSIATQSNGVILFMGGSYSQRQQSGLFALDAFQIASLASAGVGSRLMKLPANRL